MTEEDKRIYVTGKIEGHNKKEIRDLVERNDYKWSSTINEKLTLLVTGEKAGPKKLEKAKELSIKAISWTVFEEKLPL